MTWPGSIIHYLQFVIRKCEQCVVRRLASALYSLPTNFFCKEEHK